MRVLQKTYCSLNLAVIVFAFFFSLTGNSWAEEGIWTAQYFWCDRQEYAVWLRRDEPGQPKSYYINRILRDGKGNVFGEEKIYKGKAIVSEIIVGENFFGSRRDVVAFINLQNKGYLSGFELFRFDFSKQKFQSYYRKDIAEEGHLLTSYEGSLIWWRGLQSRLVLFDRKKKVKARECLLGIIPSPAGGTFLEIERGWRGSVSCFTQNFSGVGKSLKMAAKEKATHPIRLKVGQAIILVRTGTCPDLEKFRVDDDTRGSPVLEFEHPGLPTVLKAVNPGRSFITIELIGEYPKIIDIEVLVAEDEKTSL
jgi:hypothetical protein